MRQDRLLTLIKLRWPSRIAVMAAAALAYAGLLAVLFPLFGPGAGALAALPVAVGAWLFGSIPAIVIALGFAALNAGLLAAWGADDWAALARASVGPETCALLGVGLVVGELRRRSLKLAEEADQRARAERGMAEERALADALGLTANDLNSTLDLDELMQRILGNVWRVVPHDAANVMLIEGDAARVVGRRGYSERGLDKAVLGERVIISELPTFERMVETGDLVLIANTETDSRWKVQPHTAWIKSFVSAPILIDGKVIGAINLDSQTPGFFTPADAKRLGTFADQAGIAFRNARLHRLTSEKVNRLELVSQISQRTTSILELDKLLEETVRLVADSFGYFGSLILLVEGDELVTRAVSRALPRPLSEVPRLKIGQQGITGWVAAHGQPMNVPDVRADPRYVSLSEDSKTRSELAIPIRLRGVTIGVLDVGSHEVDAFGEADITTLQTIADQLAITIQNARLVERVRRRERYLEAITRVERRAAPERDPARYLDAIAVSMHEEFNFARVVIMLGDDEARELRIAAACYDASHTLSDTERSYRQPYDAGIMGHAITHGKAYLARDVTVDPLYLAPPSGFAVASELAVPIRRRGATVGVISLQSTRKDNFDDLDLAVMSEVGELLGINLENVELTDTLRRYADELETHVAERTDELQAAKTRLEALDKMKSKFVADVSHELRIPVTNLGLYIDLLEHGSADKRAEYVRTFREQVSRLATLVESILNLSRLELGMSRVQFAPVNLNDVIAPVVDAFGASVNEAGLRLTFTPAKKLPDVLGEADQLTQVISNLLSNSIRYTPSGEIEIRTEIDKERWQAVLTVRDTGTGIAEEDLPHLFERFYRGQGAAQSDIPGTGLGLAIVKEIVELHNGTVKIESKPGAGTVARITLPLAKMG